MLSAGVASEWWWLRASARRPALRSARSTNRQQAGRRRNPPTALIPSLAPHRAEQIPAISLQVEEHGYLAIGLRPWCRHEHHPRGTHPRVRCREIIGAEEEAHPPGKLLPDDQLLMIAIGPC